MCLVPSPFQRPPLSERYSELRDTHELYKRVLSEKGNCSQLFQSRFWQSVMQEKQLSIRLCSEVVTAKLALFKVACREWRDWIHYDSSIDSLIQKVNSLTSQFSKIGSRINLDNEVKEALEYRGSKPIESKRVIALCEKLVRYEFNSFNIIVLINKIFDSMRLKVKSRKELGVYKGRVSFAFKNKSFQLIENGSRILGLIKQETKKFRETSDRTGIQEGCYVSACREFRVFRNSRCGGVIKQQLKNLEDKLVSEEEVVEFEKKLGLFSKKVNTICKKLLPVDGFLVDRVDKIEDLKNRCNTWWKEWESYKTLRSDLGLRFLDSDIPKEDLPPAKKKMRVKEPLNIS